MPLRKNDDICLKIESVTSEGSGVGHYDNMAVFVFATVPGDTVNAHIIKVSKRYAVGKLTEIVSPGESRTESDCKCFISCGGCSFRNMDYSAELEYKKARVQDAVRRIGHLDIPVESIIGADNIVRYRNKAQYPVRIENGVMKTGFYAYKSHRIVPCDDCLLQPEEFAKGLKAFEKWCEEFSLTSYDENTGKGYLRHIYFRKAVGSGELMACAVINSDKLIGADFLINALKQQLGESLKCAAVNYNTQKTNVILSDKTEIIHGSEYITDTLLNKKFALSPNSFYQVNHDQCEKLYSLAGELADFTGGETLLDLYCGVGTIGLSFADRVKNVIGIEIVESAIKNAKINAELNGITNAQFYCTDAAEGARLLENQGVKPDVIIVDPPRRGCDSALLDTIKMMSPKKLIYISCDASTLARDLEILDKKGYKAQRLHAVDMFPRTPHVEAVCLLTRERQV